MDPQLLSASFPDIAVLGDAAGFDLGFRQLDAGPAPVNAQLLQSRRLTLVHMFFDRAYHQLGAPPAGMFTFGIPVCSLDSWFGRPYEASSVLPFHLPEGVDGVSRAGFRAFTLSVEAESLRSIAEAFQIPVGDVLVAPDTSSVIRTSAEMQVFRRLVQASFDHGPTRWDAEREEEIVVTLLTCATAGADSDTSTANSRARAAARALAYLREQPEEVVTVADICLNTGVALRTLNRAFREYFGVGPKAYLTRERLSRVRAGLVRAPAGTLIADVANRHGFWHMGQFARDYRLLFGELPSETSRQSVQ